MIKTGRILLTTLVILSIMGCGRITARMGVESTANRIDIIGQHTQVGILDGDYRFPDHSLPWNTCYHADKDILYGTNSEISQSVKEWTTYLVSHGWILDWSREESISMHLGEKATVHIYKVPVTNDWIYKPDINMKKLRTIYKTIICVQYRYYIPNLSNCT